MHSIFHNGRSGLAPAGKALLAAALLLGAGGSASMAQSSSGDKPLLRVSAQSKEQIETLKASGVAEGAPYRIEWFLLATATDESAALLANSVDLNVRQGTISVTLQQGNSKEPWADGKAPVTIIAAHTTRDPASHKSMVTIVHPDGPIKEPKDLKGRSITFKEGGNMNTQALLSIKQAGLQASDVKLINLNPADGLVAFRTGKVDALTNSPAKLKQLIDSGKARILYTNTDVGFPASTATVVRTADLKDPAKVEIFRDFVGRIQQWYDWIAANPAAAEKIFIDVAHLKPDDAAYHVGTSIASIDLVDEAFLANEQRIADVVAEAGGIAKKVDVRLQYDTRFNDDIARLRAKASQ